MFVTQYSKVIVVYAHLFANASNVTNTSICFITKMASVNNPAVEKLTCCKRQSKTRPNMDCHTSSSHCIAAVRCGGILYRCIACTERDRVEKDFSVYFKAPKQKHRGWGHVPTANEKKEDILDWYSHPSIMKDISNPEEPMRKRDIARAYQDAKAKYLQAEAAYIAMVEAHIGEKRKEMMAQLPVRIELAKKEAKCTTCAKKSKLCAE